LRKAILILAILSAPAFRVRSDFKSPPPLESYADTISMAFIGDVMMHTKQLSYDHSEFLKELKPLLSSADIAVANLEFALAGKPYTGYPCFSAPDSYLQSIDSVGIDVYLTANNHILDKGSKGLVRTLNQFHDKSFTGSGLNTEQYESLNPLIIRCRGARIALINFTYGTNSGGSSAWPKVSRMRKDEVAKQIERARKRGADFIIALPHWGEEYKLKHNASQESWAKWLVENGVDAIIGAHPHVVQDTSHVGGVPVIYSMGNAVSNMSAPNTQLELLVELKLVYNRMSGEKKVMEPTLHWLWCSRPGDIVNNYKTVPINEFPSYERLWAPTLKRVKNATGIE